jgi:predicted DsbA family dithiol-disulfide isomerase
VDVDIWSDIACPWCFIGKRRFEKALAGFAYRDQVRVTWHSFQLDPALPERYDGTEADYLSSRKGIPVEQVRLMFSHVTGQAAAEGLRYDFDSLVVANSMRAHELLHLARQYGVADQVKEALLSAHFEQGADIGDLETLSRLGASAGLDAGEIRAALNSGRYRTDVAADIEQARRLGIDAVPFFVLDGRFGVSGAQSPEIFTQALARASARD